MDKAHNGRSEDASNSAPHRQQTDADELLAISKFHPIVGLSCLAELLSMQQTNLERQLGELDTGKEAMSHSDRAAPRIAGETDEKDEGLSTHPEYFRSFVNRVPPRYDSASDYDTGYETASLLSNSLTSDTASSAVSEYETAVEWPPKRELQPEKDPHKEAQPQPKQALNQTEQSVVNDIIEAHYQVVEKQAEHIYRLTNVASQLEAEFRQFAEEEQIKIKYSTDRVDGLLKLQAATKRRLLRADKVIGLNDSLVEDVKQLSSNLGDADAELRRLNEVLKRENQKLDIAMREVDSLDKMYTCTIEVKKQLEAKVDRKDAMIAVLREQVDRQTSDITSLKDEMQARADESRMLRIQRDRCIEMCEEQIKNFEKL